MRKSELLAKIEALEKRVATLECEAARKVVAPTMAPGFSPPWIVTCGNVTGAVRPTAEGSGSILFS